LPDIALMMRCNLTFDSDFFLPPIWVLSVKKHLNMKNQSISWAGTEAYLLFQCGSHDPPKLRWSLPYSLLGPQRIRIQCVLLNDVRNTLRYLSLMQFTL